MRTSGLFGIALVSGCRGIGIRVITVVGGQVFEQTGRGRDEDASGL